MAVSVVFEIGHTAKLRAKKTAEGFTHDWELYVRGTNKADISAYVDKVVFNLHESFQKPKRVFKEPPYVVHESGYASFVLTVDIHFRNRDEPKRVQYPYDLDLQPHGPPHHRSEEKRFVFENPSEEFRQKLLKGGGVPVVPAGMTGSRSSQSILALGSFAESNMNVHQSSTSVTSKHKSSSASSGSGESSSKKHKSRSDDSKLTTFANLFGPSDPSSKGSSSKSSADALKNPNNNNSSAGKVLSPNATSGLNTTGTNAIKDKPGKETKDKQSSSSSTEKSKDKSDRKEKHKSSSSSSPNKDGRGDGKKTSTSTTNPEAGKSEKQRSEDKPKKDKTREKDRERSTSGAANSSSSSSKSTTSSKLMPTPAATTANSASLPRMSAHGNVNNTSANRMDEKVTNASTKADKDIKEKYTSSSSSGKRSKKDKKDKDRDKEKDKEKERRDEKQRSSSGSHDSKSKDERSHSSASQSNLSGSPSGQSTPNSALIAQAQTKPTLSTATVGSGSGNISTKKSEKDAKSTDSLKAKSNEKHAEKPISGTMTSADVINSADKKSATPNNSNSGTSSTKSHKHKKKDKNKDKDKEKDKEKERSSIVDREKDKIKDKHKDKIEDKKDIEKASEATGNKPASSATNDAKKPTSANQPTSTVASIAQPQTTNNQTIPSSSNTVEIGVSNKKSQNKEKKSKDSKISKDIKRRSEASTPMASLDGEPKSKVSKMGTPIPTVGSNIELSDADSRQSAHENVNKAALATAATAAPELHSDSSYCSFPDIPAKPKDKSATIQASTVGASAEKNLKPVSTAPNSKENKRDKDAKTLAKSADKTSKPEKDDRKRKKNTATSENTFIEPPLKQTKKDQSKSSAITRDSTKSPLPSRNGSAANSAKAGKTVNETNLPAEATEYKPLEPSQNSPNVVIAATASASPVNINPATAICNNTNGNISSNATIQRNNLNVSTANPASPALSSNDGLFPNLTELQELHHKIMTLQDNQDLQQVVEMIAASGCYEVTQRTFDFDLCKLDRSTVERLQEFFATSVS